MNADGELRVPTASGSMSVEDLEARCSVVESGLILLREIPDGSAQALQVMCDRAEVLGRAFGKFALVVDLSEVTKRPKGDYLRVIHGSVVEPLHTALVQPGSGFMRGVLRFVLARISDKTSVHATYDEAVAAARVAITRTRGKA